MCSCGAQMGVGGKARFGKPQVTSARTQRSADMASEHYAEPGCPCRLVRSLRSSSAAQLAPAHLHQLLGDMADAVVPVVARALVQGVPHPQLVPVPLQARGRRAGRALLAALALGCRTLIVNFGCSGSEWSRKNVRCH